MFIITDKAKVVFPAFVYCETLKREVKRIQIDGCRYNERLNSKTEGPKLLSSSGHTGNTRPGQTRKKPGDLSAREREDVDVRSVFVYVVCLRFRLLTL